MSERRVVLLAKPLEGERDVDRTRLLLAMAERFLEDHFQKAREAALDVAELLRLAFVESDKHTELKLAI